MLVDNGCRVVNQLDKPLIGNDKTNDLIFDSKYTKIHEENISIL